MLKWICTATFGVLSALVVWLMRQDVKKRIGKLREDEGVQPVPYPENLTMRIITAGIAAVSAFCGYLIAQYSSSPVAMVKLSLCYFATLAAAVIDYKLYIIPNLIPMILIGARASIYLYELLFLDGSPISVLISLVGCLILCVFLLLGNRLSKGGIGFGDIKLLLAMTLVCGLYPVLTVLLFALICCSIFAVAVVFMKKMTLKQSVPFGPFIYAGYVLMCLMSMY